jgi:hypothetical protein
MRTGGSRRIDIAAQIGKRSRPGRREKSIRLSGRLVRHDGRFTARRRHHNDLIELASGARGDRGGRSNAPGILIGDVGDTAFAETGEVAHLIFQDGGREKCRYDVFSAEKIKAEKGDLYCRRDFAKTLYIIM